MIKHIPIFFFTYLLIQSFAFAVTKEEKLKYQKLVRTQLALNNKINLNALLTKFNNKQIKGVEIVVAGPLNSSIMSKFGHAMFRFVDSDNNWMNDQIISFVADTSTDFDISYMKGIFGGYDSMMEIKEFPEFWFEYVTYQHRPMKRFILPLNDEILKRLENKINDIAARGTKLNYYFINQNCASILTEILTEIGVARGSGTNFPSRIESYFEYHYALPYPSEFLTINTYSESFKKLGSVFGLVKDGKVVKKEEDFNWPNDTVEIFENNFTDVEIKLFLQVFESYMPREYALKLKKNHNFRKGAKLDEIYQIKDVPSVLYSLCDNAECATNTYRELVNFFPKKELDNKFSEFERRLRIEKTSTDHREQYRKKLRGSEAYRLHLNLLLAARRNF